ncbi:MAG TPA: sulfotransferase family protein [Caulobacteraceae bacterium]
MRVQARRLIARSPAPARARVAALVGPGNPNAAFIAPDLSFLYIAVPKAANSTIKRALLALQGVEVEDAGAMHAIRAVKDGYLRLHELDSGQARRVLRGPGTFRFTFVRNPYERMVSAYKDKVLGLNQNHPEGFAANLFAGGEAPSFAAYVRAYTAIDDWRSDIHWRSQHMNAAVDVVPYDLIGRVETFEQDFGAVLARIAPGSPATRLVRPTNISPADAADPVYTEELAERVYRRYARDFSLFGYDPADYPRARSDSSSSPVAGGLK